MSLTSSLTTVLLSLKTRKGRKGRQAASPSPLPLPPPPLLLSLLPSTLLLLPFPPSPLLPHHSWNWKKRPPRITSNLGEVWKVLYRSILRGIIIRIEWHLAVWVIAMESERATLSLSLSLSLTLSHSHSHSRSHSLYLTHSFTRPQMRIVLIISQVCSINKEEKLSYCLLDGTGTA